MSRIVEQCNALIERTCNELRKCRHDYRPDGMECGQSHAERCHTYAIAQSVGEQPAGRVPRIWPPYRRSLGGDTVVASR